MHSGAERPARWVLPVLIASALFLRFYQIQLPFVEPYNSLTRQSIVASVARNFYERDPNFLNPEIDENGAGPYLYNAEMPFYSYAMALAYRLAGGVREAAARSVSVLLFFAGLWFFWRLACRVAGEKAAAWGTALLVFAPWWVAISRSIQPEATLFFASIGTLSAFNEWIHTNRRRWLILSILLSFLAVATKITSLYLAVPVVLMMTTAGDAARNRRGDGGVFLAWLLAALAPLIWYAAMMKAGSELNLAYEPYKLSKKLQQYAGQGYWQVLLSGASLHPIKVFAVHAMMPVGLAGLAAGLAGFRKARLPLWVGGWLLVALASCLVLWRAVVPHPYYLLPLLIPAALIAGAGFELSREVIRRHVPVPGRWLILALLVVSHAPLAGHFYRGLYALPPSAKKIVVAGRELDRVAPKDALIATYLPGSSPILIYYSHRRGWRLNLSGADEGRMRSDLERYIAQGASFFVTTAPSELNRLPAFKKYLERYPVIRGTDEYVIFELIPAQSGRPPGIS